jgi:hypothetical protein
MIREELLDSGQQRRIGDLHGRESIGIRLRTQEPILSARTYWPKPMKMRHTAAMATDPEAARAYLKHALRGVSLKSASEAIGKNHAYLQQYITTGKPRWLPETVREALVRNHGLDGEQLKPPPTLLRSKSPVANRGHERQIDAPSMGKFVDDPGKLELLDSYDAIHPRWRELARDLLRRMAVYSLPNVA